MCERGLLKKNYEKLREAVLDSRSKSGKTDYLQRQFLMFIELVDIFELALANPVQYEKVDTVFAQHKEDLKMYVAFIKELSEEGLTMLIVTHEMKFAREVATRILFLHKGEIIEDGTPSQVMDHPKTERARQFFSKSK